MEISLAISHFTPTFNVKENLQKMLGLLAKADKNEIVVMPEGCLSGYSHDLDFLSSSTAYEINEALIKLEEVVSERNIHLIFGSCIMENNYWYNAGIYISPKGVDFTYKKVNLATHERDVLKEGNELTCFEMNIDRTNVKASIQLCREIRFPEQWKYLSLNGSQMLFYLTNVLDSNNLSVWNAHLMSRAAENQSYVISSNIAHSDQGCSTMVISPKGDIVHRLEDSIETIRKVQIDLSKNSNWYLSQSRTDIVDIVNTQHT
ncbi:putative amidohydrolase [Salibacterium salarium]|uniref:carbon-nitrogen hydrolase family protein n=1 Tax=Salibacterium salarium TaxID=284579 RepID=UPI002788426C|nr:carbon-nitrogen hydrolase family protein [Salibacterium salarium]MDQ0300315.1 putative amidohydrolase [Salibacterium salarium]